MPPDIEIVLPLRNPTEVLDKTITSLVAQTDRSFGVLMSDNHSTSGVESITQAAGKLRASGIPVDLRRPPEELGRVEHWNWSHRQAHGSWIKPLFTGDWLEPGYVERTRATIEGGPDAEIVHCSVASHHSDGLRTDTVYSADFQSPEQVLAAAFTSGNCFGGPVNICFKKFSFDLIGGYPPALPVSADFWVILMLALRRGLLTSPEVLAHFNYHPHRFSTNFPSKRIHGPREFFVILAAASSYAAFHEIPHAVGTRNRLFMRLLFDEMKRRIKTLRTP